MQRRALGAPGSPPPIPAKEDQTGLYL
jgi:hypothetical protein